jgi:hypothetical protein
MNKASGDGMNYNIDAHLTAAETSRRDDQIPATKKDNAAQEGELKILFPWTLHSLLEDAEKGGFESIISWRPSGMAFKVHNREKFMNEVLPRYFKQTKFKSFVRQLNLWGFSCIDQIPDKGSCMYTITTVSASRNERKLYSFGLTCSSSSPPTSCCLSDHHKSFVRGNANMCKEMRRTKIKKPNPPSMAKQAASNSLKAKAASTNSSTVTESNTTTTTTNSMRSSVSDPPRAITGVSSSSTIGQSIYAPGATLGQQHASAGSTKQILSSMAYAQANSRNNLGRRGQQEQSSGDWLDKLEAAIICPTTTAPESWMKLLEPRPIRPVRGATGGTPRESL